MLIMIFNLATLYYRFNLIKVKLYVGVSAEHRDLSLYFLLIELYNGYHSDKALERAVFDADLVSDLKVEFDGLMFETHLSYLVVRERHRL